MPDIHRTKPHSGTILPNNLPERYKGVINVTTMKSILETLLENGHMKRTQLSAKTGMNYARCLKYVNALKSMKLAEIISDNNSNYVTITQAGIKMVRLLNDI
jgi:predicted transcriptional regulator